MVDQSAGRHIAGWGGAVIGRWRSLGPTDIKYDLGATGRIMCLAVHPTNGSTIYAGSIS